MCMNSKVANTTKLLLKLNQQKFKLSLKTNTIIQNFNKKLTQNKYQPKHFKAFIFEKTLLS